MSDVEIKNDVKTLPFKVKDISLADWGRKEIKLAEAEMPGLMTIRKKFKADKVRLYSPSAPEFLSGAKGSAMLSQRQRFHLDISLFAEKNNTINGNYADESTKQIIGLVIAGVEDGFAGPAPVRSFRR